MCNHSLDALSGCQSGRGLFPKDVLQMRTHRTTPGMRPGLKHPPLQPTTWLEKRGKNKKQHQQEEESMMAWSMKDHSVGPGGLLPIPTLWRTLRIGWERGCDGEKHPHEDQPFNERPGGRLAPLKGVCWESRAPINKKHGSGIVFPPPTSTHPSLPECVSLGVAHWWCCCIT